MAVAGCGESDSDTDAPGGTARASALTECLKNANMNVRMIDNKQGSARAFSVHREQNDRVVAYAYVFENPDKAKDGQDKIFKPDDKETVAAYTEGDTLVITTSAAADVQPRLGDCFKREAGGAAGD